MMKGYLLSLSLILLWWGCSETEVRRRAIDGQHYIAHAGGSIDGHTYTNSREAVEHAIACGITYIELDLGLTSDHELVAVHDWGAFNEMTTGIYDTTALTLDEFRERKIYDRYTPLAFADIDSIWEANPGLVLVTDKISDPAIIGKYFHHMKERVVVECFRGSDFLALREAGFLEVMLSQCPPAQPTEAYADFDAYCFWHGNAEGLPACIGPDTPGYLYAVFSYPDRQQADALFALDPRIKLIYIDDVE